MLAPLIVCSSKTKPTAGYNRSHIWLACGSISNLNLKMCKALKGRHVTLYPDLGAYDKWLAKARVLQRELKRTTIHVSNVLELNATDAQRKEGLDIGDVLG